MVSEGDWRAEAAASVEALVERIDEIRRLVEQGSYMAARRKAWGSAWMESLDLARIPADALISAQQWIDLAFESLHEPRIDPKAAAHALIWARRVISG